MKTLIVICIALFLFCVILAVYIISLKRQMKNVKNELVATRDKSYNRQISISIFDKDFTEMSTEINKNLDYQKQLKYDADRSETKLRQSISDIAHDLRTPLTVIKGNLQMLSEADTLSDKDKAYLETCNEKADTLKNMVDDFFEMSVLESDSTPVDLSEINVTNLLMQFIVDNEAVIRNHKLTPDIILPEKSISILADKDMLVRMLGNLLTNILKYAYDSFCLKLEQLKKDGKSFCDISFSNKLSEGNNLDVKNMFERTYRGNQARTGQGAGLGLYIVKLLAEKQRADVYAEITEGKLITHMVFRME